MHNKGAFLHYGIFVGRNEKEIKFVKISRNLVGLNVHCIPKFRQNTLLRNHKDPSFQNNGNATA